MMAFDDFEDSNVGGTSAADETDIADGCPAVISDLAEMSSDTVLLKNCLTGLRRLVPRDNPETP